MSYDIRKPTSLQLRTPASLQPIPAPVFDGSTDVERFLDQFEAIADHNLWSPEERQLRLTLSLQGPASRGVGGECYEAMCEQLRVQYALSEEVASTLLKDIRQGKNENIYQFAERVTKLVRKAYPGLNDEQRAQQVKREVIAFVPENSQLAWTLRLSPPESLDEVISVIHKYDAFSKQSTRINRVEMEEVKELREQMQKQAADQLASQESMMKQFAAMQSTLLEQLAATQTQIVSMQQEVLASRTSTAAAAKPREVRCYNCNERGHYARECRKPKKSGNDQVQSS